MRIAIDIRSLQSGSISGVENYIQSLIEYLLPLDRQNQYVLFSNAFKRQAPSHLEFINSQSVSTRIPNKVLNLSLSLSGYPKLESLAGDFDALFLPNLNQFSVHPTTKVFLTIHDLSPIVTPEFYNLKRRLWHTLLNYKKALKRANTIFAVSEFTKMDLMHLFGVPSEKIAVIYPGINHDHFSPLLEEAVLRDVRNRYELPGEFILFLSTIEPRKNLFNLIKAFERLPAGMHLVIAGKLGWSYREIIQAVVQSPKRPYIHHIGFVDEADKPALLKLARVVAYPSFYEGFGFVPLEAMSVGTPVLTSNVTSLPEVVGDGALLINPYQIDDIAKGLWELARNNELRQQLIVKGLEQSARFTWEKTSEQFLSHFITQ